MKRKNISLVVAMTVLSFCTQSGLSAGPATDKQDSVADPTAVEHQLVDKTAAWKHLHNFVRQSDIAFRGTVSNIQYKLADPAEPGQAQIPYTYVTYDIKEMIHGAVEGNQVVLRFIGGLDEKSMLFMGASNVPNFDLGDDDILFVQGNTRSTSPLVFNDRGRFRVVDGQVYSDSGREVTLDDKNRLHYGKRHRLQEILTTTVSGSLGTIVMEHKIIPDAVEQASQSISADALIDKIRGLAIPSRTTAKFLNADIYSELTGPSMKPAAPPKARLQREGRLNATQSEETLEIGEMPAVRQPRTK